MDIMDNIKDKMGDMSDDMKGRFEELKGKADTGQLDDKGREELEQLRSRFEHKG